MGASSGETGPAASATSCALRARCGSRLLMRGPGLYLGERRRAGVALAVPGALVPLPLVAVSEQAVAARDSRRIRPRTSATPRTAHLGGSSNLRQRGRPWLPRTTSRATRRGRREQSTLRQTRHGDAGTLTAHDFGTCTRRLIRSTSNSQDPAGARSDRGPSTTGTTRSAGAVPPAMCPPSIAATRRHLLTLRPAIMRLQPADPRRALPGAWDTAGC